INSAINDILAGLSARVAAKKWAIPRTTLRRQLEDGLTRAQAHEHQQRLSKAEEERVRRWIVSQELLGYAPTHRQLRYIASQILQGRKDLEPLGRSWKDKYDLQTPRNGLQVVDTMRYLCPASPCTRRLLTRYSHKAARTIDLLSVQLVLKDRELEAQKALNERLSHKKRRAVEPDKNEIFCSLAQIKDVQGGLDELRRKRQRVRKPRTSNDDNTNATIIVATS
ncbi:unnamed protein product, partial [Clonostachys chloroleuca]